MDDFLEGLTRYRDAFYVGSPPEERYYVEALQALSHIPLTERPQHIEPLLRFLNRWKCRFSLTSAPRALERWMTAHLDDISALDGLAVSNPRVLQLEPEFERLFASLIDLKRGGVTDGIHNMGDACASKILHVTLPSLFVMWDASIKKLSRVATYGRYMSHMHDLARRLTDELAPQEAQEDLERYLQDVLGYPMKKTLAKQLDEYNWFAAFGHTRVAHPT